jgi:hypothetical protein
MRPEEFTNLRDGVGDSNGNAPSQSYQGWTPANDIQLIRETDIAPNLQFKFLQVWETWPLAQRFGKALAVANDREALQTNGDIEDKFHGRCIQSMHVDTKRSKV